MFRIKYPLFGLDSKVQKKFETVFSVPKFIETGLDLSLTCLDEKVLKNECIYHLHQ